jgi:hypothetical protein
LIGNVAVAFLFSFLFYLGDNIQMGVMVHAFNPRRWISEFEASLVYKVSSRTARTIQTRRKKKSLQGLLMDIKMCSFFISEPGKEHRSH